MWCWSADRGMITKARISEDIKLAGLDWITTLRGPAIKALLNSGAFQSTRHTGHHLARLPRRATGGLPQPGTRRRTQPQVQRSTGATDKSLTASKPWSSASVIRCAAPPGR
jgi:hypothetical protein